MFTSRLQRSQVAKAIAREAFDGKIDMMGKPMIDHSLRVGDLGQNDEEKAVGYLHDVLEDTGYPEGRMRLKMRSDAIVDAVVVLTKKPGEKYEAFVNRILTNPLAARVKLNDLKDNMSRLVELGSVREASLRPRYIKAKETIESRLKRVSLSR